MKRKEYSHIEFTAKEDGLEVKMLEPIQNVTVVNRPGKPLMLCIPGDDGKYAKFLPLEPYEYFRETLTGVYAPRSPRPAPSPSGEGPDGTGAAAPPETTPESRD